MVKLRRALEKTPLGEIHRVFNERGYRVDFLSGYLGSGYDGILAVSEKEPYEIKFLGMKIKRERESLLGLITIVPDVSGGLLWYLGPSKEMEKEKLERPLRELADAFGANLKIQPTRTDS